MKEEKIAVCITAQTSSQRLIDYGSEIAQQYNGSLHILHVQKGDSIFQNGQTLKLLTKLLAYGDRCGGIIHVLCDQDIPKCISEFVKQEEITKVIIGELPKQTTKKCLKEKEETQFQKIITILPQQVEVITVGQQDVICTELKQKIG
ncbi:hypothetical protein [Clostridium sp. MD294]|uniref:hypothetical protein n=1 Tax=Clostridium sp. MD294 TaxID=97138 RepID=UPI0002C8E400|nr:hypothetical protein [Clostridium sp. MD294]NDO47578.1 hypothetical protein [Clostridium sp. MD294]USF29348.1 hypothetical protein C820_000738 [Clostridium sp. MD294]